MKDNMSKQIILSVLGVAILIVAVVGVSYAVFNLTLTGEKTNTITTGTITMDYTEDSNGISITNAMPTADSTGKTLSDYFDFTVKASVVGVTTVNYEVVASKVATENPTLADTDVKLYLEKENAGVYSATPITSTPQTFTPTSAISSVGAPAGTMLLYSGSFSNSIAGTTNFAEKFRLRMWLKSDAEITATIKSFSVRIDVYGTV